MQGNIKVENTSLVILVFSPVDWPPESPDNQYHLFK